MFYYVLYNSLFLGSDISPKNRTLSFSPYTSYKCASFVAVSDSTPEGEEIISIDWSLSGGAGPNVKLVGSTTTQIVIRCKYALQHMLLLLYLLRQA